MDEEFKTKFFKLLDKYYTLKHPNELGVEPENKLMALIDSYSREAELKGQIKAFRSVPQIDVDLEQWLWEQIDPLEAELKALGAKPEGKPNE